MKKALGYIGKYVAGLVIANVVMIPLFFLTNVGNFFFGGHLVGSLVVLAGVFLLGIKLKRLTINDLHIGLNSERAVKWLATFAGFFLLGFGVSILSSYFPLVNPAMDESMDQLLSQPFWMRATLFLLIAPLMEEIYFRRLMADALRGLKTPGAVLIITALVFAGLHPAPLAVLPLGIFLGLLTEREKRLVLPVLAHFVLNAFALFVPRFELDDLWILPLSALFITLGTVLIIIFLPKPLSPAEPELADSVAEAVSSP